MDLTQLYLELFLPIQQSMPKDLDSKLFHQHRFFFTFNSVVCSYSSCVTFSVFTNKILSTTIGSSAEANGVGSGGISSIAAIASSRENNHFFINLFIETTCLFVVVVFDFHCFSVLVVVVMVVVDVVDRHLRILILPMPIQ